VEGDAGAGVHAARQRQLRQHAGAGRQPSAASTLVGAIDRK
jgi:hypothetical protein